ncbi:MAG: nitronate monooxygenase [Alphaproteobacteria bacterium]|nr:MAG: nitronate monooxygenase [Alphaproteobacteria bacterium]
MGITTPICDLLGITHPVLLAGMGGVSYSQVCAAVSNAGGFGTLGMAGRSPEEIRAEMRQVRALTDRPFGVDLLAAMPEQMEAAADVIIEEGARAFISGLGVPESLIQRFHDAGVVVMSMCGKVRHAVKAAEAGVDVVIAQGTEGGGHTGQVATMALIPQVVDAVDVPVVGAGGLFDGRGLAAVLALGAVGAWMGTRFIASEEAHAAAAYKQRLLTAREDETLVTRCYSGKPMRVIRNEYVERWEATPEKIQPFPMQVMHSAGEGVINAITGVREPVDPARDCLPAGQGVGALHDILPAGEIVRRTVAEAEETIAHLSGLVR